MVSSFHQKLDFALEIFCASISFLIKIEEIYVINPINGEASTNRLVLSSGTNSPPLPGQPSTLELM